ncbi:MAG: 6-phosphogluconate dehydrogenase [Bacteroidia bacterium]|nr:6-phosphogluconate dehydrogenase [Bacteroidia bacterium]
MFKKFLLWTFFIGIALVTLFFTFVIYVNFSDGKRAGEVIKMSRKGVLVKTYEGQLNTGGFSDGGGDITSSIWHFSVKSTEKQVLDDIDKALDGGYRVKLYYREKYTKLFFLGDTKYFVYKVERVADGESSMD